MKSKKRMNFIYFRPTLVINDQTVDLNAYFEKISEDEYNNSFGLTKDLNNIKLTMITHHKEYKLDNGIIVNAPLWELRFIKTRIDVPNKINIKSYEEDTIRLAPDEQIFENTVLIYDSTTNIVIINQNREAVSHSKIASFINHFITDDRKLIKFDIMADKKLISKAQKQEVYTALTMRLINFNNPEFDNQIKKLDSLSVVNAIKTAKSFNIAEELVANLELTISLKPHQKNANIEKNDFRKTLTSLLDLHFIGLVDKIKLKSRKNFGSKVEEMDLIDKLIKDTFDFIITEKNRNISSTAISNAIVLKYNIRRNDFLKK